MVSSKSSIDKRDVYYRQTKSSGYRARSAFKLLHLSEDFDLFSGVETAVDMCAAPGSWSQVLSEKLKPGPESDTKVVSLDLQPMAPLPGINILQTDITLPSTIPLVLNALGGRKADLVVCDGAPDVTGVHDLDSYLHSQLLLAALTLALTLMAPQATLVFKIFLSPLDPHASMLRSQLHQFFPSPLQVDEVGPSSGKPEKQAENCNDIEDTWEKKCAGKQGYDMRGRRGGVWVRKPRSSRPGSAEAFLICRNFDPKTVPLPETFSSRALAELAKQTKGTLTLDSLAQLGEGSHVAKDWDFVKAYVGSGDLDSDLALRQPSAVAESSRKGAGAPSMRIDVSHAARQPISASAPTSRIKDSSNRLSLDSLTPPSSSSPTTSTYGFDRSWDRKGPSPLPSPILLHPPNAPPDGLLGYRESDIRQGTPSADGAISPALSSSSKNDLFFGSTVDLPTPPKPLARDGSIGRGTPSTWAQRGDRSVSTPTKAPQTEPMRSSAIFDIPAIDISLSGKRNVSQPDPPAQSASPTDGPSQAQAKAPISFPSIPVITRRESQQLEREHKQIPEAVTLNVGDTLVPVHEADDLVVGRKQSDKRSWKLERRIGEGAFSSVWAAAPTTGSGEPDSPLAAVKLLARSTVSANARTRISFVREVEVLRHIAHPGIVSYLSSFSTPTHHCLVLERLEGGELFELVSDQANRDRMLLSGSGPGYDDTNGEGFVRRLFGELCKAVGWLHEVHAVHRDIKLENIILTVNPFSLPPTSTGSIPLDQLPTPLLKLTDFGLSRFISSSSPMLTTRCGSESFAAPEIIMGRPYDGRDTDSWAVGVVLYALIVGELPFDTADNDRRKKMLRIAKAQYTYPEGVGSEPVRQVINRLLVRDPKKRTRVGDIWDAEWMQGAGAVERPTRGSKEERLEGGRKKVLDGFLVDAEAIDQVALAEEA